MAQPRVGLFHHFREVEIRIGQGILIVYSVDLEQVPIEGGSQGTRRGRATS
ncbi:hypothetical protein [Dictyobacter kobayashii]|uniref:hypothetical protein n=1 Tax=Dictyobacter kobayashii TaxID=2014872 RepID=UPI0013876037|nr:hypothetical protein [Dictyobacter kobayashii]